MTLNEHCFDCKVCVLQDVNINWRSGINTCLLRTHSTWDLKNENLTLWFLSWMRLCWWWR